MANNLKIELKDKWVKARGKEFFCMDGFGCSPQTNGNKILGYFKGEVNSKGEPYLEYISGYEVTELAGTHTKHVVAGGTGRVHPLQQKLMEKKTKVENKEVTPKI